MITDENEICHRRSATYLKTLINILQPQNADHPHEIHSMIEIELQLNSTTARLQNLESHCFYNIKNIIQSAYVIRDQLVLKSQNQIFYVNNYID